MAAAVKAATDKDPIVFGKPHPPIADYLMKRHHINPGKTLMFGDRWALLITAVDRTANIVLIVV